MRKIGTTTSAICFILLGIWIMINSNNPDLGKKIIKFWPIIIILIGIEILYYTLVKKENERIRISGLVFVIIIVSFLANISTDIFNTIKQNNVSFDFNRNFFDNVFESKNLQSIDKKITLEPIGNKLNFETLNGKLNIEKAADNKITIDTELFIKQNRTLNDYELNPINDSNGYTIKIIDDNINSIKATIYLPEGYDASIKGSNLNVYSDSDLKLTTLNLTADNGKYDLQGDIPNSSLKLENGKIDLSNNLCKNIDISMNNGSISLDTKDKNLSVNTDINRGTCKINDEKRVNSGISKKLGTGEDIIRAKLNNGTIKINSGE
ncbi:LiaF transmembrane domain-containing protein [Clostridium saccharoperbutylacetonicum]